MIFPAGGTALTYSGAQALDALFNFTTGLVKYVRVEANGATIQVAHSFSTSEVLLLFNLAQATNLQIDGLNVVQTNAISFAGGSPYGTVVVSGSNNSGDPTLNNFNISLANCKLTGGMSLIEMSNSNSLWMEDCHALDCFYGVLGLDGIQGFSVHNFYSSGCYRDIFLKGVTNFDIDVTSVNAVSNAVLLSADDNELGAERRADQLSRVGAHRACVKPCMLCLHRARIGDVADRLHLSQHQDQSRCRPFRRQRDGARCSIRRATTSNLSSTYEDIHISGKISGALNWAGKLFDLFTAADSPWNGETARNIVIDSVQVTGSTTPTFFVDYAPFLTATAGAFVLRDVLFPGNYTDANNSNVATQLCAVNAHFANFNGVLGASWGGTGLYQPTAHGVVIAAGSAPMTLAAIGTAGRLLIDKGAGADPAFTAMSGDATITSGGALTIANGAVTNAKLANSSVTLNAGTGVGLTAPGSVSLGGTATIGATTDAVRFGTLALGTSIGSSTLAVTGTVTDTNQAAVANLTPNLIFTSGSNVTQFGMLDSVSTAVSGGTNLTSITAFYQNIINVQSSASLALGIGFRARISLSGASPTGTITASAAAEIAAPTTSGMTGTPSLTVTAHRGLWVRNQGMSASGLTATASYGIDIDAQSGSTANYALRYNSASPTIIWASGGLDVGSNADPAAGYVNALNGHKVATTQVVGARITGYTAMTGTPDKATAYATSTVTLPQLAGRMMQLQADLTTHGLIGA